MDYHFRFQECSKCGREFLVEKVLFGVDHTIDTIVTCRECLAKTPLPKDFIKQQPEEAKAIQEWLTSYNQTAKEPKK